MAKERRPGAEIWAEPEDGRALLHTGEQTLVLHPSEAFRVADQLLEACDATARVVEQDRQIAALKTEVARLRDAGDAIRQQQKLREALRWIVPAARDETWEEVGLTEIEPGDFCQMPYNGPWVVLQVYDHYTGRRVQGITRGGEIRHESYATIPEVFEAQRRAADRPLVFYRKRQGAKLAALETENERLRLALAPFARVGSDFDPMLICQDDVPVYITTVRLNAAQVCVGDLRRAARVLEGGEGG